MINVVACKNNSIMNKNSPGLIVKNRELLFSLAFNQPGNHMIVSPCIECWTLVEDENTSNPQKVLP